MPTGLYITQQNENEFRPEVSEKYIDSYVWMDYIMMTENIEIVHKLNNGKEIRFENYFVDGYCVSSETVYEYNGCCYHKCPHTCFIAKRIKNKKCLKNLRKHKRKMRSKSKSKLGFNVPFNSQGHIGTGSQHCHLWDSNPQR